MRARSSTNGRISVAPSEQFTPTISGFACSTEYQKASTVCPDRLRPLRSIAVNEIQRGTSGATSSAAAIAALALSVSKIVSIRRRSTPPSTRPRICSAYASTTWSNVAARYVGSSTRGETERETLRGPLEPRALDVHLVRVRLERVVALTDGRRRERVRRRDVRAGGEVRAVDVRDDLGARDVEDVGIARERSRVVGEPLAAVRLLAFDLALDQHSPGPVEHDDPLVEKLPELLDPFAQRKRSRPKEGRERELRGSLGVW